MLVIDPSKYASVEELIEAKKKHTMEVMQGLFGKFGTHAYNVADDFRLLRNIVAIAGEEHHPLRTESALFAEACILVALKGMPFDKAVSLIIDDDLLRKPEDMQALREIFKLAKEMEALVDAEDAKHAPKH